METSKGFKVFYSIVVRGGRYEVPKKLIPGSIKYSGNKKTNFGIEYFDVDSLDEGRENLHQTIEKFFYDLNTHLLKNPNG